MGSTELAANLFRATQTDEKLRNENITDKELANQTHYDVGSEVRQTIKRLGGTMPENLPTPDKSIKKIEKEQQKKIAKADNPLSNEIEAIRQDEEDYKNGDIC